MKKILCFAALSTGAMLAGAGVASAQETPPPPSQPPAHPHTVAAGESLSTISQVELATSDRWVELFALNRNTIANPNVIEVGQVLDIPSAPVAVPPNLLASLVPVPPAPWATAPRRGAAPTQAAGVGGNLASVRACESGGDYGSVSSNGLYRGAYQFDVQTWQSVGGSGDPSAASPAEQDARAGQLASQRGSSPWPNCG